MKDNKTRSIIFFILLAVLVFYVLTIREGHYWGDDFSMYIRHAINIVEGFPYDYSGYIFNKYLIIGPRAYPPIFPILLSPIYLLFGIKINAFKVLNIILFVCLIYILYISFKTELRDKYIIFLILLVGFNPYLWDFKDNILSDIPFSLFLYLSLYLINKFYSNNWPDHIKGIFAGTMAALSFFTRTVGLVLIPSIWIYDLIKRKHPTIFSVSATAIFVVLAVVKIIYIPGNLDYFKELSGDIKYIIVNSFKYGRSLGILWHSGEKPINMILLIIMFTLINILFISGIIKKIRQNVSIYEIYFLLYILIILLWPSYQGIRFFIPIIPLYLFYSLIGIQTNRAERYIFAITIASASIIYILAYFNANYGQLPGIGTKESKSLFAYIINNTKEDDIIIFARPRALALFTNRRASIYHRPKDHKELWRYFKYIDASYIILAPRSLDKDGYLEEFVDKYIEHLEKVYFNDEFIVFKIKTWPSTENH